MNEGLIPKRYAKALYKYASDEGAAKDLYEQMQLLAKSYAQESGLVGVIDNPFVAISDKEKVLLTAGGASKGSIYDKFILLVIKHNRENFMREIALDYQTIYCKNNDIAR